MSQRRRLTAAYKRRVLAEADACTEPGQVGARLRREGWYSSHLTTWRRQRAPGVLAALTPQQRGRKAQGLDPLAQRVAPLERDHARLSHQLQQAETIIAVQKKVAELLGLSRAGNPPGGSLSWQPRGDERRTLAPGGLVMRWVFRARRGPRRRAYDHKLELLATGPHQVWSWEITTLKGAVKWSSDDLSVLLAISRRDVVGWMVASARVPPWPTSSCSGPVTNRLFGRAHEPSMARNQPQSPGPRPYGSIDRRKSLKELRLRAWLRDRNFCPRVPHFH